MIQEWERQAEETEESEESTVVVCERVKDGSFNPWMLNQRGFDQMDPHSLACLAIALHLNQSAR
jgi:hypothetical protein